jgi:hypothetical protein
VTNHGEGENHNADESFYFVTAREAGDRTSFSMAAIADLGLVVGTTPETVRISPTFDALFNNRDQYEFIWLNGDLGYANDWMDEIKDGIFPNINGSTAYTDIMNAYYDQFTNVTMNAPLMVGPGNHEAQCGISTVNPNVAPYCVMGQRNFTSFRNHFSMPIADQTANFYQNMWYSYDYGMAHFVQINTETDFPGAAEEVYSGPFGYSGQQLDWLKADLAAVDRTKTPWVIVGGHRPYYSSNANCIACQDAFESIMVQFNVDVVWFGHVHFYERVAPMSNGTVDPKGLNNPTSPWYITNGAAGNVEGHSKPPAVWPSFVQYANGEDFGWSKFIFHNSSYLTEQYYSSDNGTLIDEATLYKDHGLNW